MCSSTNEKERESGFNLTSLTRKKSKQIPTVLGICFWNSMALENYFHCFPAFFFKSKLRAQEADQIRSYQAELPAIQYHFDQSTHPRNCLNLFVFSSRQTKVQKCPSAQKLFPRKTFHVEKTSTEGCRTEIKF